MGCLVGSYISFVLVIFTYRKGEYMVLVFYKALLVSSKPSFLFFFEIISPSCKEFMHSFGTNIDIVIFS